MARPLTVTLLAGLWALAIVFYGVGGLFAAFKGARLGLVGGPILALVSGVMAYGLLARARWARSAQLAIAALGLFTPFMLPSVVVLLYMLRQEVAIAFSGRRDYGELTAEEIDVLQNDSREGLFAAGILLTVLLTVVAIAAGTALFLAG